MNDRGLDIKRCVADLMLEHNCVVVPGLGGFIGNYAKAYIDPVHHTFHPPSKKLLFNVSLSRNDGLLANRLSETSGISFVTACRLLDQFSDECRESLRRGQPVLFPSIGRLIPGSEGTILLEQDLNNNLLPEAYGLNHFMAPPVIRTIPRAILPATEIHSVVPPTKVLPQLLRWAAFFALPAGTIALMGITGYDTITSKLSNAGILLPAVEKISLSSLFETKKTVASLGPEIKKTATVQQAGEPPDPPSAEKETITSAQASPVVASGLPSSNDGFAVIVGAFRMKENAERYILELNAEGHEAIVYDVSASGLYRVAIGTSQDRKVALQILANALSEDFSGAWLLSK